MKSWGNSRDVKNARSKLRARFRPSFGIPFRIFLITGGYIEGFITKSFNGIRYSVFRCFGSIFFGVFSFPQFIASNNNSLASPSSEFGMNDFISVIFRGSASDSVKFSIWSFVIGIDANAVFSWREYGARNKCLEDTRITSTASSVDLIMSSTLNCSIVFCLIWPPNELVSFSFTVLILQVSQKWISSFDTLCIFPLQFGQMISFLLDFMCFISVLHFMSGHLYIPISFVAVGFPHFGQRCSEINSPFSLSFSRPVKSRIALFRGPRICLWMYPAINLGHSGNLSFVCSPLSSFGKALKGTMMWNPFEPENLMP